MAKKKVFIETKVIDGFQITYENEEGVTYAVGTCPVCGQAVESRPDGIRDAGKITVSKLRTHINMTHKGHSTLGIENSGT